MLLRLPELPDDPLEAAAQFHREVMPRVLAVLDGGAQVLTLVFAPDGFAHEDWRRAAVATLARERSPARINAVAGDDEAGIAASAAYLAEAPGVTGHYLVVDSCGSGPDPVA
ncbi:MAG TPA: hypothetical protein VI199_00675 [Novosphingobium sp.]